MFPYNGEMGRKGTLLFLKYLCRLVFSLMNKNCQLNKYKQNKIVQAFFLSLIFFYLFFYYWLVRNQFIYISEQTVY